MLIAKFKSTGPKMNLRKCLYFLPPPLLNLFFNSHTYIPPLKTVCLFLKKTKKQADWFCFLERKKKGKELNSSLSSWHKQPHVLLFRTAWKTCPKTAHSVFQGLTHLSSRLSAESRADPQNEGLQNRHCLRLYWPYLWQVVHGAVCCGNGTVH